MIDRKRRDEKKKIEIGYVVNKEDWRGKMKKRKDDKMIRKKEEEKENGMVEDKEDKGNEEMRR